MAISQKEESRALNADERALVEKSHHPRLQELPDRELFDLVKLMRNRRERAKTEADRRRREMRGKAAPKGMAPSRADEGSKLKLAVLAMAVRRLNSEAERRRQMAAAAVSRNALPPEAMPHGGAERDHRLNSRHAGRRMRDRDAAASGPIGS